MGSRERFVRGVPINPIALRQARLNAELSLARAARGIVTPQALHQFEGGKARPIMPVLQALAERLGISVDALRARPHDPRERDMRELEERQRWDELDRLANRVLSDLNITPRTTAVAHFFAGRAIVHQAPHDAIDHLREARRQLAKFGEPWLAAEAMDWEAVVLYYIEDLSAVDVGRKALARYRMLRDRDPRVEARMLEHIATCLLQRHEYAEAVTLYKQALDVASKVLDLTRMANIYHGLAEGCLQAGQPVSAMDYMERAINFYRSDRDVRGPISANLARAENDYGCHLIRLGQHLARAEEMIRAAIDHFTELGIESGRGRAMRSMGELRQAQDDLDEAIDWTVQGVEIAERLGEVVSVANGYQQLGELWAAKGDVDRFEASFARALEIIDRAELPGRRSEALARYHRARSIDRAAQQRS